MADPYEIAQGKAIRAFLSNAKAMAAALKDLGALDEPEEFRDDLKAARAELKAMRSTLLAKRAVVEAAERQAWHAERLPDPDKGYEPNRANRVRDYHAACGGTENAVRAYIAAKEQSGG